jgi:hypothetical protein
MTEAETNPEGCTSLEQERWSGGWEREGLATTAARISNERGIAGWSGCYALCMARWHGPDVNRADHHPDVHRGCYTDDG